MKSKRSHEGYIMYDHSQSPGIGAREINMIDGDLPTGIGRTKFEAPTYTCSHCQRVVVLNPLRQRERAWCQKCDQYICDECGAAKVAGADCVPYIKIIEAMENEAVKNGDVEAVYNSLINKQRGKEHG